jgi:hypothetical protein
MQWLGVSDPPAAFQIHGLVETAFRFTIGVSDARHLRITRARVLDHPRPVRLVDFFEWLLNTST